MHSAEFKEKALWNGEPAIISAFIVKLLPFPEPAAHWQNELVGTERQVLQLSQHGQSFLMDNETGQAYHKVTVGHGCMPYGHRSIGPHEMVREVHPPEWIRIFDVLKHKAEEASNDAWLAEHYPEVHKLKNIMQQRLDNDAKRLQQFYPSKKNPKPHPAGNRAFRRSKKDRS